MGKLFKSVDEKFADIGFIKMEDDTYIAYYERYVPEYNFTQSLIIMHKASGKHIVSSYDKNLHDEKHIGNTSVGLTYYEMKLVLAKMRQKKWKSK